jgi:hypothetical protein
MDDLQAILLMGLSSYMIEYLKIEFNLTPFNIILFVNLIGIYYITQKLQICIRINYNL